MSITPLEHPLSSFKYCPKCGSPEFVVSTFKSKKCNSCGFHYFYNAAAASTVFIRNEKDEVLVATRATEPSKGTLDIVGGFVDFGESFDTTAVRETLEETGITIQQDKLVYLYSLPNNYIFSEFLVSTCDAFFEYFVRSDITFKAEDDVSKLQWIKINDLQPNLFGLQSIRKAVDLYMQRFFSSNQGSTSN
ncbi:NADH pyrophosphatase, putative [Entamoeba invadens IP1]|uniref:NADH pyrophosphatase, putative n=1 Tax=Entamoeba invadens IP1 TaxID=370355 RepID=A0A0A1UF83_ENTIV|nr:NADH pyrophosphatase, putative [Entamoeba invadens IP1]ELP95271.1 NADH pyrophosphatase, putative [Entamoeba invadens IP1]|eukprot:XP_004262042.1 NADH pyrophosphatase, putative [Entamoeba invadens IP1]